VLSMACLDTRVQVIPTLLEIFRKFPARLGENRLKRSRRSLFISPPHATRVDSPSRLRFVTISTSSIRHLKWWDIPRRWFLGLVYNPSGWSPVSTLDSIIRT